MIDCGVDEYGGSQASEDQYEPTSPSGASDAGFIDNLDAEGQCDVTRTPTSGAFHPSVVEGLKASQETVTITVKSDGEGRRDESSCGLPGCAIA